jgi:hypothetical protein
MDRDGGGGRNDPSEEDDERGRSSEPVRRPGNGSPPPPTAGPPTPGGSEGGAETGAERSSLRRWYDSLSRGVQRVVTVVVGAGAVAAAIGAILALWPDPDPAPHAKLTNIMVDPVGLQEWEDRHRGENNAQANTGKPMLLAAYQLAQAETDGITTTEDTTTQEETTTDETTTEETTTDGTTTDGENGPGPEGDIVTEPLPSAEQQVTLNRGLDLALDEPSVPELDLGVCGEDLSAPNCGLRSTLTYLLAPHSEVTAGVVAGRLEELFHHLRTSDQDVPPEPLGMKVDFDVVLTHFQGEEAEIRWSLYTRGGGEVPRDWLRNQRVLSLEAEADKDSGSGVFWAPLPSRRGSYYIQFGVYDEDGKRLTYKNTGPFP